MKWWCRAALTAGLGRGGVGGYRGPPSELGGAHETVVMPLPPVAVTSVGVLAGDIGVAAFDGVEVAPLPAVLPAVTMNV